MVLESAVEIVVANPEWGWLAAFAFGIEQLFAPWETRLKQMVGSLHDDIDDVHAQQVALMTVVRALARVHDDINTEEVDRYLVANDVEPADFIDQSPEPDQLRLDSDD